MAKENWLHFTHIDNFANRSSLYDGQGILRPNRFVCLLNAPPMEGLTHNGWLEWQVMNFNCPSIAVDLDSMEINSWPHYYIKGRTDTEFEITFLESADLTLRYFFYSWMNQGFNQITGIRRYIKDVQADVMKVMPLNFQGESVRADCFYGVFPIEINSLDYDMAAEDTLLKTNVKFKYIFHTVESVDPKEDLKHRAASEKSTPTPNDSTKQAGAVKKRTDKTMVFLDP